MLRGNSSCNHDSHWCGEAHCTGTSNHEHSHAKLHCKEQLEGTRGINIVDVAMYLTEMGCMSWCCLSVSHTHHFRHWDKITKHENRPHKECANREANDRW